MLHHQSSRPMESTDRTLPAEFDEAAVLAISNDVAGRHAEQQGEAGRDSFASRHQGRVEGSKQREHADPEFTHERAPGGPEATPIAVGAKRCLHHRAAAREPPSRRTLQPVPDLHERAEAGSDDRLANARLERRRSGHGTHHQVLERRESAAITNWHRHPLRQRSRGCPASSGSSTRSREWA